MEEIIRDTTTVHMKENELLSKNPTKYHKDLWSALFFLL